MNLTLFAICYVTALSTAVYIGYRIARNKYFLQKRNWKASGVETSIISLFGLILSFTLLLSGNASKDRLNLIHEHVDALSTLYRDASFVSVPVRDTVQSFVLQILEEKVFEDRSNAFEEDTLIVSSNRLYKNLWLSLLSMHDKDPQLKSDIKAIMVGVNNATALHYRIEYGAIERMPWILIAMITICSLLVGVLVGFSNGFNENDHYLAPIVFVIMTSIMVMVILDINNPKKDFSDHH